MAKILYIEDELSTNIATIRKFFFPILNDKRIKKELDALELETRPYPDKIVDACKYSTSLDICYRFLDALYKIIDNHQKYDLIIIDRNLSQHDYSENLEDIQHLLSNIGYENIEERLLSYHEREGDLLLKVLVKLDRESYLKTYFLTANTRDGLRDYSELQTMIDMGQFIKENIVEKGSEAENKISKIISNMKSFKMQNKYREQCDIIRKNLSEDDVNDLVKLITQYENSDYSGFLGNLRKLFEKMVLLHAHSLEKKMKINRLTPDFWDVKYKDRLAYDKFLARVLPMTLGGKITYTYNDIIRNAFYSIHKTCSEYGSHPGEIENLSKHTFSTVLSQFFDFIKWYDTAIDSITRVKSGKSTG